MSRFLAGLAVVFIVLVAVFVGVGWITFHKAPDKATVEIHTQQMEQAGERAVERSRKMVEDAADSVKKAVHDDHQASAPGDKLEEVHTRTPASPSTPD